MESSPGSPKAPASRNVVLAVFVIAVVALAVGGYALASLYSERRPAAQTRTFLVSIDFYNSTSAGTTYTSARFTPDTLTAFKGDTVIFNVTNRDPRAVTANAGRHGFTVDGTTIATTLDPAGFTSQTVTNLDDGIYRFYCQLHTAHLSGQLVVAEGD